MAASARGLIDYPLVDADHHYYEPDDAFTRYMAPEFRDDAITVVRGKGRYGQLHFQNSRISFFSAPPGDLAGLPGSYRHVFADPESTQGLAASEPVPSSEIPESLDRDKRLTLLDQQNVQAGIFFPTTAVGVEADLRRADPAVLYANFEAFNRWVNDDWGWHYEDRIFAVAALSLVDIDMAVAELDRVLAEGARVVNLLPGPVMGRSPADPHFDPFWARCEEAGIPVSFHVGNAGFEELFSAAWGENPRPPHHRVSAFQHVVGMVERPINDTMAALVLHNLFGRFPKLKTLSVENGSTWVGPLLKKIDLSVRMAAGPDAFLFGRPDGRPSEIFREHVKVCPFPEDNVADLIAAVGPDLVLFGSDWPHPEGLPDPVEFADQLGALDYPQMRKVMRGNCAALLGLAD